MSLLNDASLVFIPSGYKEDKVYSIIPSNGAGDLDFVRGCDATRINPQSLVETTPWNLLTYSEQFDNAAWVKNSSTITANATTAPDGTTTADALFETAIADSHQIMNTLSLDQTTTDYTFSFFVKANGRTKGIIQQIYIGGTFPNASGVFDLTAKTIINGSGGGGVFTNTTITEFGNGWFRVSISGRTGVNNNIQFRLYPSNNLGEASYLGDVTKGLYIWGAQANFGQIKPYFPTTDRLNVPRLDYTNSTCPSLLLEKQSTNIALYSEQFNNAAWTTYGLTVSANSAISPDGTQNADKLIVDNVNDIKYIYQINTVSSGASYTASAYFKSSEYSYAFFRLGGVTGNPYVIYNLTDQSLVATSGSVTHSIQSVGNGWYRINLTVTSTSTIIAPVFLFLPSTGYTIDASNLPIYIGNGVNGGFVWGFQLEASSYPTSYIPTTSASVTRLADSCSKTGISSLIGQTEGTIFCDVNLDVRKAGAYFTIAPNLSSGTAYIGVLFTSTKISFEVVNSGLQVSLDYNNSSTGRFKCAFAYANNDFIAYVNGIQIGIDTSGTVPTCSQLGLFNYSQEQPLKYNQALLFKRRLTNTELENLTTL